MQGVHEIPTKLTYEMETCIFFIFQDKIGKDYTRKYDSNITWITDKKLNNKVK